MERIRRWWKNALEFAQSSRGAPVVLLMIASAIVSYTRANLSRAAISGVFDALLYYLAHVMGVAFVGMIVLGLTQVALDLFHPETEGVRSDRNRDWSRFLVHVILISLLILLIAHMPRPSGDYYDYE